MQAYPGRGNPLLAALRGEISPRELRVMLEYLPQVNPLRTELHGQTWSTSEWLMWGIESRIRELLYGYAKVHFKGEPPDLKFIPTPDVDEQNEPDQAQQEQEGQTRANLTRIMIAAQERQPNT